MDRAGFGLDGVEPVAYRSSAGVDFGCGELGELLGGFGIRFQKLGEIGECSLGGCGLACFWIDRFDGDGGEVCCAESGEDVDAFEGCGALDLIDRGDDGLGLVGVVVAFLLGEGAGVGAIDGQGVEVDHEIGEDGEGAFLGAEGCGFVLEAGEAALEGALGGLESVRGDESGGVVGGAVDFFARRESLEGLVDVGAVLAEFGNPEAQG